MTDPYIGINGTKIEFFDNDISVIKTLAVLAQIGGWTLSAGGTYASSTIITVASGAASIYQKSDKLRLRQGSGWKWYYIILVTDTSLYIVGDTSYPLVNLPITDFAYSHAENPSGFPHHLNYTPTLTGGNTDLPSYDLARFKISGNSVSVEFAASATLSGTAGTIIVTMPVTCAAGVDSFESITIYNGTAYVNTLAELLQNTANYHIWKTINAGDWVANETGVNIRFKCTYEF